MTFPPSPFNEVISLAWGHQDSACRRGHLEKLGLITSGVAHCYAMEALERLIPAEEASREGTALRNYAVLKIGTTHPLPADLILDFAADVDRILVVEEQDPYLEEAVRNLLQLAGRSNKVLGKETGDLPYAGEYSPDLLFKTIYRLSTSGAAWELSALSGQKRVTETAASLGKRKQRKFRSDHRFLRRSPPASFTCLKKPLKERRRLHRRHRLLYSGECAALSALDTCLCMGAG